jgi:hypothetical protein
MHLKEPLVPMHLFQNQAWNAATIVSGLGASVSAKLSLCRIPQLNLELDILRLRNCVATDGWCSLWRWRPNEWRLAVQSCRSFDRGR